MRRGALQVPAVGRFPVSGVISPLWKRIVAASLGTREAKLLGACRPLFPDADRDRVRAEILSSIGDAREADLVERLHSIELGRIAGMGPKLPQERREALLAAAELTSRGWAQTLDALRACLSDHPVGRRLLQLAHAQPSTPSQVPTAAPSQSTQPRPHTRSAADVSLSSPAICAAPVCVSFRSSSSPTL